jgi:hypothetical protein
MGSLVNVVFGRVRMVVVGSRLQLFVEGWWVLFCLAGLMNGWEISLLWGAPTNKTKTKGKYGVISS